MWGIVSGERNAERAYLVPLEIKDKPKDLIITSNIPNFLDVRIQGPRSFIMGLNPKDMAIRLDLSGVGVGRSIFPITPEKMKVPRGVRITRINPSYVTLDVERLMNRTVRIKGEVRGKPADDFIVEAVEVMPQSVNITGPESEVKGLRFLKTSGVDISGIRSDLTREVPVDILGRKITLSTETPVTIRVRVKEVLSRLELKGTEVEVISGKFGTSIKPSKIALLLEGPKSVIDRMKKEGSVKAQVDARGLEPGVYKRVVKLELPDGIKVLYSNPKEITLEVLAN